MLRSWLTMLFQALSRGAQRRRERTKQPAIVFCRLELEPLEARLAPAVTSSFAAGTGLLTVTSTGHDTIAISVVGGSVEVNGKVLHGPVAATAVNQLRLIGSASANIFDLSQLTAGVLPNLTSGKITGAGGTDTLIAPTAQANSWSLTGSNQGTLDGVYTFANIENLTGGNQSDTFAYTSAAAVVTGTLSEVAGGNVVLTGASITVPGTINTNGGNLLVNDFSAIGTGSSVTFSGSVFTQGGNLNVFADTITVATTAGPATLSTRDLASIAADPATAASLGDSGSINFGSTNLVQGMITDASNASPIVITDAGHGLVTGETITVAGVTGNTAANGTWRVQVIDNSTFMLVGSTGNGVYLGGGTWTALQYGAGTSIVVGSGAGSKGLAGLYSQADGGFSAGAIGLLVAQNAGTGSGTGFDFPLLPHIDTSNAGVTLNAATVMGGDVTINAAASSLHVNSAAPSSNTPTLVNTGIDFLQNLSIIGGAAVSTATATVTLSAASTIVATSLNATAAATSDAESLPIAIKLGVAIAITNTTASLTASGHITTTGDTSLEANAVNTLAAIANAGGNLQGAGAGIAIGVENSSSTATVSSGAVLNVGGGLTVQATTVNNKAVMGITTTGDDGNAGVAVAIAYVNDTTTASMNGTATVGGDATIEATEVKNGVVEPKFFFIPSTFAGVASAAGVGTDDTGDLLVNLQGAATTTVLNKVTSLVKKKSDDQQQAGQKTQGQAPAFQAAASVAIDMEVNTATATVGTLATLEVTGNLTVDSNVNDRPVVVASAGVSKPSTGNTGAQTNDPTKFDGSVAIGIGLYTNTANSSIGAGATVDAGQSLSVTSEALNDYQFSYLINLYQAATATPTHTTSEDGSTDVTINPNDTVQVDDNHTGGGNVGDWYQYSGAGPLLHADLTTQDFSNSLLWTDLGAAWEVKAKNVVTGFTTYTDGSFGADNNLADTWTQATSTNGSAKIAVAGSATYLVLDQTSNATISPNAQVNQNTAAAYRTGQQTVFVLATATNSSLDLGGSVQTPGLAGSNKEFSINVNKPGAGLSAAQAAVGAALIVVQYTDNVSATVGTGVHLYADSLDVDGETAVGHISSMISGASSDNFGFNGVFFVGIVNDTTLASIAAGATVVVGSQDVVQTFAAPGSNPVPALTTAELTSNALPGTAGVDADGNPTNTIDASLVVAAHDGVDLISLTGGIMAAQNAGVGAAAAVMIETRDTEAYIGDASTVANGALNANVTSAGNVIVDAKNTGFVAGFSLAAAKVANNPPQPNTNQQQSTPTQGGESGGSYGVGISADVAFNQITDTTLAYLHDAVLSAPALQVNATNNTLFIAVSGSVAIVTDKQGVSVGIAGSYSQNNLSGSTSAFLDNATTTLTGDLTVDATTTGQVFSIAASGSAATSEKESGTPIAIAGQVSVNDISISTEADVADQSTVSAQNVSVTANDTEGIFAVAGALAYGGKAGVGASVSINTIPFSGSDSVWAFIADSAVTAGGTLAVAATAIESIQAITAAIAASSPSNDTSNGLAAALSFSLNTISLDTEAYIRRKKKNGQAIQTNGTLSVTVSDTSTIQALAGSVGLAKGLGGFGLSFALDTIGTSATPTNTIAEIQNTTVNVTGGSVIETATDTPTIMVLALGGGGAKNQQGKATVGAGAAGAVNSINGNNLATIDGSIVNATNVNLTTTTSATVDVLALGLGGALQTGEGGGVSLAGAGSGAGDSIDDNVEASIKNGSSVTTTATSSGSVTVAATDTSSIVAAAGAVALSIATSSSTKFSGAVGVSVAVNSIGTAANPDAVTAAIEGSTVHSGGGVALSAVATESILAVTVAGSVAADAKGDAAFAGAGAGSQNQIFGTVQALVNGGSTVSSASSQAVTLLAQDNSNINADAGGVALGYAGGSDASGAASLGAAAAVNGITTIINASIAGSTVTSAGAVKLTATTLDAGNPAGPGEQIFALAIGIAGALASGGDGLALGLTGAGSGSNNQINTSVNATITSGPNALNVVVPSNVTAAGAVNLTADGSATITAGSGAAAVSLAFGGTAATGAIGISLAINSLGSSATPNATAAEIIASTVTANGGAVMLDAENQSSILAVTVAGGVGVGAGEDGFSANFSGAGAGSQNQIFNNVEALITNGSTVNANNGGAVSLTASDTSSIQADSGGLALGFSGSEGAGIAGQIGAALALNSITETTEANIDHSTVTAVGTVTLSATASETILAVAVGVQGSLAVGEGFGIALGGAGSGSSNTIDDNVEATVTGGSTVSGTDVSLTATSTPSITAGSGALSIGLAFGEGGGVAVAIGVSVALNNIGSTGTPDLVIAGVESGSTVHATGGMTVTTDSNANILAVTVAGSVNAGGGEGVGVALGGAGAGSENNVYTDVEAVIEGGSTVSTGNGQPVQLAATDTSRIDADGGGLSLGLGFGAGGFSGQFGAAAAVNSINSTVLASIIGSTVTSAGAVDVTATTETGLPFNPATALNTGTGTITFTQNPHLQTGDPVTYSAGGGTAIGGLTDGKTYYAIVTDNGTVNTRPTQWFVQLATSADNAHAGTAIPLTSMGAGANHSLLHAGEQIQAITVGVAGALGVGEGGGISLAGAGSGSGNTVNDSVEASIKNGLNVLNVNVPSTVTAAGAVALNASDDTKIIAGAGALSLSFAGGEGGGIAGGVGLSIAVNSITDPTTAAIEGSTVHATAGGVNLAAVTNDYILAITVAGTITGAGGEGGGIAIDGAGAGSGNTITNSAEAFINSGSTVTSSAGQAVQLNAADTSFIEADGGGVSIGIAAGGGGGVAVGLAAGAAINRITNTTVASIEGATVTAGGDVDLTAVSTATIKAVAVGFALQIAGGGIGGIAIGAAGAGSGNHITNTTEASIKEGSHVTANSGAVSLTATDDSSITATAGVAALAGAGGANVGISAAIGASINVNEIANQTNAFVDNSTVTTSGGVTADATSTATITSLAIGATAAVSVTPPDPDDPSFAAAIAGVGASSTNTVTNTIQAYLDNKSTVTAGGNVQLSATDNTTSDAEAYGGALTVNVGLIGLSLSIGVVIADNTVDNTVATFIGAANTNADTTSVTSSTGTVTLTTLSTNAPGQTDTEKAEAVAAAITANVSIGASLSGAGGSATNTTGNNIGAFIRGGSTVHAAGDIDVIATDKPTISGTVGTGALGISLIGASLGISLSSDTIGDTVTADIDDATVTTTGGNVDVHATSTDNISVLTVATALNISIGVGGVYSEANATDSTNAQAAIGTGANITANAGTVTVQSDATPTVTANSPGGAAGLIAFSALITTADIEGSNAASVGEGVTITSTGLTVQATSTNNSTAMQTLNLSIGGVTGSGSNATSTINRATAAFIGPAQGSVPTKQLTTINVGSNAVAVTATSNDGKANTDMANIGLGAGGAINVAVVLLTADLFGSTSAYVGGNSQVNAGSLTVHATSTNYASASTNLGDVSVAGGAGAKVTTDFAHNTSAFLGAGVNLQITGGGDVSVKATSINTANASAQGGAGGGLNVTVLLVQADLGGTTKAYVSGAGTVAANEVDVEANATNTLTANLLPIDVSIIGGAGGNVTATLTHATAAYIGTGAALNLTGNKLDVAATSSDNVTATTNGGSGGGINAEALIATANLGGTTTAYLGGQDTITAGEVDVTADATKNIVSATSTVADVSLLGGAGANMTADLTHVVSAYIDTGAVLHVIGANLVKVKASSDDNSATATAQGGSGGAVNVQVMLDQAVLGGSTTAYIGGNDTLGAGEVDVLADATNNTATATILSVDVSIAGGAGGTATVTTTHQTSAYVDTGATLNITGNKLDIAADSTTHASTTANGGSGGAINAEALFANTNLDGSTTAVLGGHDTFNIGEVDVTATDHNTATATTTMANVSIAGGAGANINSNVGQNVAASVSAGSTIAMPAGALNVAATSNDTTTTTLNGGAGGVLSVTAIFASAQIDDNTQAFVGEGATVGAAALSVLANAQTRSATTNDFILNIGLAAGGAGANTTAFIGGTTEAFTGPQADAVPNGSPTTLNVTGAVAVAATAEADQANVTSTVGSGAILASVAAAITYAQIGYHTNGNNVGAGNPVITRAYLGDNTVIGSAASKAGLVTVTATGADVATSTATVGSGGILSGAGTDVESILTPTIEAYIGNNVQIYVSATTVTPAGGPSEQLSVDVEATSLRAEGHTTGNSYGGGGVQVGIPQATTTVKPTVAAFIDGGSSIFAGGDVKVLAAALAQPSQTFNDQIQGVNTGVDPSTGQFLDSIDFPSHGLLTGNQVVYDVNGSGSPIQTPTGTLGALDNGNPRVYNVIVQDANHVQLGNQFSASSVNATGPLPTLDGVDPTRDEIRFPTPDLFQTGDAVHYDTNGNGSISSGMNTAGTYYVRVIDPYTIKLYTTFAAATAPFTSFNPNAALGANGVFNFLPAGFTPGTAVTYLAPAPLTFHSTDVNNNDTTQLHIDATNLQTGEEVQYSTNGTGHAPLAGLSNNGFYFVYKIDNNTIQLCHTFADATHTSSGNPAPQNQINLAPDTSDQDALTATEALSPVGINGLTSGVTYFVANPNVGNHTFQLRDANGNLLTGITKPGGNAGNDQLGLDGIAMNNLASAGGTQDLHLAFTSPSTNSTTGDELLAPVTTGGVLSGASLRLLNPPAGSGESSASAVGGDGGFVAVNLPLATTNVDPTVKAYDAASLIQTAGSVFIMSESIGHTSASTNNNSGGFIDVSQTHSITNFGESGGTANTSEAFIGTGDPAGSVNGTGVSIVAGGQFVLSSDSQLTTTATSNVDGGGFIKDSEATSDSNIYSNTYSTVGSNAQIMANSVSLSADMSSLNVTSNSNATAYGFAGVARTHSNSNANSTVLTEIDGGTTRITGTQGVDVRARNENYNTSLNPDSTSSALWIPFHDGAGSHASSSGTFATNVKADAGSNPGATVVAGPRPSNTPLVPAASLANEPYLALYVQAQDSSINDSLSSETRAVTWNANVVITSGPAPLLIIVPDPAHPQNGLIATDDNIQVSDGALGNPVLGVGSSITSGTAVVHDITSPHLGQAYFVGDNSVSNSPMDPPYPAAPHSFPLFTFDYSFGAVRILNYSDENLQIHQINVDASQSAIQAGSGEHDVQVESPGVTVSNIPFMFRIAESVLPSLIDIENLDTSVNPSDIDLTDVIQNPIGQTIIKNVRGNIYATTAAAAIWTNTLDLEASDNIGTAANPIVVELIESVDPNNGNALRPIVFTATATTGNVYLDLTARRRDGDGVLSTDPFVVPIQAITAGGDINVKLEESMQDPKIGGNAFGLTVGVDNTFGNYQDFFYPSTGAGSVLDYGVYANVAAAVAISTTTYDFQPSTGQVDAFGSASGAAGLTAGGNIIVNAVHSTPGDPTINIVGTLYLTGAADYLETTTNGSINYGEGSQGGTLRVHTVQSTAASVMLTVTYPLLAAGQDLDLIAVNLIDGLISAATTVLLRVGDNLTTQGDPVPTNPAATMIAAGTSITIDTDYGNPGLSPASTVNINGALSSPLTNINSGGPHDVINLNTSHDINSQTTSAISDFTGAVVNVNGVAQTTTLKVSDATYQGQDAGVLTNSTLTGLGMGGNGLTYNNLVHLEVDLSQGNVAHNDTFTTLDYFAVLSTHTGCSTVIEGGAGNDTVVVASDANVPADGPLFTSGTLAGILGALSVDAQAGAANRLIVSNYASAASQTVQVTNSTITNFAPVLLTYAATGGNFTNAGAHDGIRIIGANVGGNTFNVPSTLAGSTTRIDGDGGASDFFNVFSTATGSGAATNASTGNDRDILGDLEVVGGTGTTNRLIASDTTNPAPDTNVIVTNSEITGLAPANLYYSATGNFTDPAGPRTFDGILLLGPSVGGNTFNVQSTLAGSTTQILGDGGNADYFNVFSNATGAGPGTSDATSNVLGILGKLTVVGGTSLTNRLIVSDKGDDGTHAGNLKLSQIVITDHSILNLAPAFIYYSADPPAVLGNFTNVLGPNNGIWIQGSLTAPNTYLVYSTLTGSTMQVDGGAADDNFNFGAELATDIANPDTTDPVLPVTFLQDQGDLNPLQGLVTINGNGGSDNMDANDHGQLYTIGGVVQYAVDDDGNPVMPLTPLHINDDGTVPATEAPAAALAGDPHYQYTENDPAYGYNYLVTPNMVFNDPSTVNTIPKPTTPPARTFAGIVYNLTGDPNQDTVAFVRLDGTDRTNRFIVQPDIKNVTTFMIDGNMPNTACRKDGGDYLDLDTTHMGAPGSPAVFSRTLHIFTTPNTFAGTIDGTDYYPDLTADGAGDFAGTTVAPPTPGKPLEVYTATTGVDSSELASPTGNGYWGFVRGGKTYAKPVYFLSIEHFNHVAITAQVSVPPPNSNQVPYVIVRDAETGDLKFTVQPYESYFHGGINVAVGDLNCDGIPDLATIPQAGHKAEVKIFNGSPDAFGTYQHKQLNDFLAFNQNFLGGGSIAIGDVNYDGHNDLIIGAGQGYVPVVEIYTGPSLLKPAPTLLGKAFYAFNSSFHESINQNFKGGVNVAAGDLNNDGYAEIIATVASNGPPLVNVFNGNGYGLVRGFNAFSTANYPGGLSVAVGDVTGDGVRDIVVGSSPGYVPEVAVFSGATFYTEPTVKSVKTIAVAPLNFRGAISVQVAATDGGDPGTVELDAIFAQLIPAQAHSEVANEIFETITSFDTSSGNGSKGNNGNGKI